MINLVLSALVTSFGPFMGQILKITSENEVEEGKKHLEKTIPFITGIVSLIAIINFKSIYSIIPLTIFFLFSFKILKNMFLYFGFLMNLGPLEMVAPLIFLYGLFHGSLKNKLMNSLSSSVLLMIGYMLPFLFSYA